MKKALLFTSMFALALFTGCGGDSGDDEDRNVSGTWSGAMTRVSDTCNSGAPQTANFTHTVTQNGEAVTLLDQNATRYLGNLLSDDGFSADATVNTTSGSTSCTEERQVEYDSINDDDDEAASMEVRIERHAAQQSARSRTREPLLEEWQEVVQHQLLSQVEPQASSLEDVQRSILVLLQVPIRVMEGVDCQM